MECGELQEIRRQYGVHRTEALEEVLMFMKKKKKSSTNAPLEIIFQIQRYTSLHSGRSLAWITFTASLPIPVPSSPISTMLSPIPVAIGSRGTNAGIGDSPGTDADCCATH